MDKEEKEKILEEYRLFIKELTGEDLADNDERGSLFSRQDVFGTPIYSDPYKVGDKVEVSEFIIDVSGNLYVEYVGEGVIEEIDARRPKGNRYRVSINGEDYFTGEANLGPALDAIEGLYFSPNDSCPSFITKSSERGNNMKCLYCGKEIPDEQAKWIEAIGVEPYCDNYCFSMDNYGYPAG